MAGSEGGEEPLDVVKGYLDREGIAYEVVTHEERFTAASEARAAGVEPQDAVKDVVLRAGEDFVLAAIPASERLDLRKVSDVLEVEGDVGLASEEEIGARFGQFELGALPPFGPLLPAPQLIDRRLLDHERVFCNAGDHRHGVLVDPRELERVAKARIGDVCED